MPVAPFQTESVRKEIGKRAERLKGPLVENVGPLGNVVNAHRTFIVGGNDAIQNQVRRLEEEVEDCRRIGDEIKNLVAKMEIAKRKQLLDDTNNLDHLREWGEFARQSRSDQDTLLATIDRFKGRPAGLVLGIAWGDLVPMFSALRAGHKEEYDSAKAECDKDLKEVDAYVSERLRQIAANK